jgi:hypothetical protein
MNGNWSIAVWEAGEMWKCGKCELAVLEVWEV